MLAEDRAGTEYRPLLLDPADPADGATLAVLRADPAIEFTDLRPRIAVEYAEVSDRLEVSDPAGAGVGGSAADRWVYYPWRRRVLGLPGPALFRAVRLDRNRNKLTRDEQRRLGELRIGVVGQSVGHAVAYTLALEGICGELRLADFDEIELSNLNRIPVGLFDIGINKAAVTARRIAELDPYLPVEVIGAGLDDETMGSFVDGLSILIEECDSLDIKLRVREAARARRVPVLMETSDRGLLDVERFDLEPDRPVFHGLLGDLRATDLRGLNSREKAPYVMRILGGKDISARMAASMVEVGASLTTWPQLGSDVLLGGATVANAVRRIGLGTPLLSGRVRIDVEQRLDAVAEPEPLADSGWHDSTDHRDPVRDPAGLIVQCAGRAPSGGNMQPWAIHTGTDEIRIELDPRYTSPMDIGLRGSAVAVGAALYNARVAAAARGRLGAYRLEPGGPDRPLVATLCLGDDLEPELAADYPAVLYRETNRGLGSGARLPASTITGLRAAAGSGTVRLVTAKKELAVAAELLAGSDRVRYLTPQLHRSMFDEMRFAGDDLTTGIDVRSLELAPDEAAAMAVARRADVMAYLKSWSGGSALGDYTRDRVESSSALAAVGIRFAGTEPALTDYARAGMAVEKFWVHAQRLGLAVQPLSPVFLYARRPGELAAISPDFVDTLASLQDRFLDLLEVPEHETIALVLRLSYTAAPTVRSRRRAAPGPAPRS